MEHDNVLPHEKPSFEARFVVEAPLEDVLAFHSDAAALERLTPPLSRFRVLRMDPLGEGSVTEFTMQAGPLPIRWRAVHRNVDASGFTDVQESGPMARWIHRHSFRPLAEERTEVRDRIWYTHPPLPRGLLTRLVFGRGALRPLFWYRRWATRRGVRELQRRRSRPGPPTATARRRIPGLSWLLRAPRGALSARPSVSRTLAAGCEDTWRLLVDTSAWPTWGISVSAVEPPQLTVRRGARGRVRTRIGVWAPFAITQFVEGAAWRWSVFGVPATGHYVEPAAAGHCTIRFDVPLWLSPYLVVCWFALRRIDRMVRSEY